MKLLYLISILPAFEAFTPSLPKAVIRGGGGGLSRLPYGVSDQRPALVVRKMSTVEMSDMEDVCTIDDPEGVKPYSEGEVDPLKKDDDEYKFQFHFRNFGDEEVTVSVHHHMCLGSPSHEGRALCWRHGIAPNTSKGLNSGDLVYAPGGFVINSGKWWEVIKDGIALAYDVAMLFVPGPNTPSNMHHDVPEDPKDGIEDAMGIFGDVFALGKDTVTAMTDNEPPMKQDEYDKWIEDGRKAIPQAADAIGIDEKQVYDLAAEMDLGDKWALLAGDSYFELVRDNNKESNEGRGWSVFKGMGGSKCKHYLLAARACFVHKGHLIYPVFPWTGNLEKEWSYINDRFWYEPDCCPKRD